MSIRIALARELLRSEQNKLPDAMKMLSSAPSRASFMSSNVLWKQEQGRQTPC